MSVTAQPSHRMRWWRELLAVMLGYIAYTTVRNTFAENSREIARQHADEIIAIEKFLRIYNEYEIQRWFLKNIPAKDFFFVTLNTFYGTAHFVVTIFALVVMYKSRPTIYRYWRNALLITTMSALICFAAYPLMPPRMLSGYVDTIDVFGGPWTFDSSAVEKMSNQFAAMPSLHCAWAIWCAFVMVRLSSKTWQKILAVFYPFITLFAIILTANHFWLDAVGGVLVLMVGCILAAVLERAYGTPLAIRLQSRGSQVAGTYARGQASSDRAKHNWSYMISRRAESKLPPVPHELDLQHRLSLDTSLS